MRTSGIQFGRRWAASLAGVAIALGACTSAGGGAGVYGGGAASAPAAASEPAASQAAASTAPSASSGGGGKYSSGGGDEYGTPASKPPAASAGAGGVTAISVGNGTVGAFLTGEGGKTLYIFKKDSPNTSACAEDCAVNWPPLIAADGKVPGASDGVTGALTTFARADGSMQVAYDGAPLYYYAGDTAAGDTNGDGIGGVWSIAAP